MPRLLRAACLACVLLAALPLFPQSPAAPKRTPLPAAPSAETKTDDIEPDAVNLDNLSKPLVAPEKKPDAAKPQDSSK